VRAEPDQSEDASQEGPREPEWQEEVYQAPYRALEGDRGDPAEGVSGSRDSRCLKPVATDKRNEDLREAGLE
jgi:hypothetical protein